MPFGLKNATSVFTRFIHQVVGKLRFSCVLLYVDDILCYSPTFEQHMQDVAALLDRLNDWGVVLKPSKCNFFHKEVEFLGHIVSEKGLEPMPDRTKAIADMPLPSTTKEIRTFLGQAGYYRSYIKNFGAIAKPLYDDTTVTKFQQLSDKSVQAVQIIKNALTSEPILKHPDWTLPFEIHCDASVDGLGATLVQHVTNADGVKREHVIQYISRTTNTAEKNYHQYLLECAALTWSIRMFRPYVSGDHFTVYTDNAAVKHLMNRRTDDLGRRKLARWIMELSEYDMTILHRNGKKHTDADGLSRLPLSEDRHDRDRSRYDDQYDGMERLADRLADLAEQQDHTHTVAAFRLISSADESEATHLRSLNTIRLRSHKKEERKRGEETKMHEQESSPESETKDESNKPTMEERTKVFYERVLRHDLEEATKLIEEDLQRFKDRPEFQLKPLSPSTFRAEQTQQADIRAKIERWKKLHNMSPEDRGAHFQAISRETATLDKARAKALDELSRWRATKLAFEKLPKESKTAATEPGKRPVIPPQAPNDKVFYESHIVRDGIIYDVASRRVTILGVTEKRTGERVVVPRSLVTSVLRHLHGIPSSGHLGRERTLHNLRNTFTWKGCTQDVRRWVKACAFCMKRKARRAHGSGLTKPIVTTRPGQLWCIDFVGPFPPNADGCTHILTMHDAFTRWPIAVTVKERNIGVVIKHVMQEIVLKHGPPEILWSDREPGFAGAAMKHICKAFGIVKAETTGYQPQANSTLERFHDFMNQSLTLTVNKFKSDWSDHLEMILWTYRTSVNAITGYSPFFLMYGRDPHSLLATSLGITNPRVKRHEQHYGLNLTRNLKDAYSAVVERQALAKSRDKQRRDQNRKPAEELLPPGSWCMLWEPEKRSRNPSTDGELHQAIPRKLEFRFTGPWRVHEACDCGLHRWIIHAGRKKLVKMNVNRLRSFHPWDDVHIYTNTREEFEKLSHSDTKETVQDWGSFDPVPGDLIIVNFAVAKPDDDPFWIARILELRPSHERGHLVQWFGNSKTNVRGTQQPGWVSKDKSGVTHHYFRSRPTHSSHRLYTNDYTNTVVDEYCILRIPPIKLTRQNKIPKETLLQLSSNPDVSWTMSTTA